MTVSRRSLLVASAGLGLGAAVGSTAFARPDTDTHGPRVNPFTLGVASGDPSPTGVVLWTRLATNPLADDGLGGMAPHPVPVHWEVCADERMCRRVASGLQLATRDLAHSVHVEVDGLAPGREYWFRFRVGRHLSPTGRTRTAPARHELPAALAMAFASCAQYEHGFFGAYRALAADRPDLVLHLGDYQYEYKAGDYVATPANVRDHRGPETVSLANYRQRHAQYKADADLQAAHAVAPWLVVWDDHEVDNNWADDVPENADPAQLNDSADHFRARRRSAFQAYWENMPLRRSVLTRTPDMRIYRRLQWGRLANFHMMDTRQYRDDQACGDGWKKNCVPSLDPARTLTGAAQERWLLDGFRVSTQRWDLLGQQVFFAGRDRDARPDVRDASMDGWDGYVGSRERITRGWVEAGVRNPVVLTGDVHRHWANDLTTDYADPDAAVVGSELVCSSITSGGDGTRATTDPTLAINPHLKITNDQRGYVRTMITPERLRADFRSMLAVSRRDAGVETKATFDLHDGVRGLHRV